MSGVNLRGANLGGIDFENANFRYAQIGATRPTAQGLERSGSVITLTPNLEEACLRETQLQHTIFDGFRLRETDFSRATLGGTALIAADLTGAQELDLGVHRAPSSLGMDTILRSKGQIPEVFLRGCGVPDAFIQYLPSLFASVEPIQFHSCFISHSHQGEEFANRLASRRELQEAYERFQQDEPKVLTLAEQDAIRRLAADVPAIWHAATTTDAEQKGILRQILDKVVIHVIQIEGQSEWVEAQLHWAGGHETYTRFRRPVAKLSQLSDWPELQQRLLARKTEGWTAQEIAEELNRESRTSPHLKASLPPRFARHSVGAA